MCLQLPQAGILSIEEQIIDTTTEEGQKALKDLEEERNAAKLQEAAEEEVDEPAQSPPAATEAKLKYDDPE